MLRDFFKGEQPTHIDDQIEAVIKEMNEYGPSEPEYKELMDKLERLEALKAEYKPKRISRDTLFLGAVNLLGIAVIVFAEKQHVLSQKAMAQVHRALK